ncbi:MAG: hypothetical protein U0167_10060 [bacterium]
MSHRTVLIMLGFAVLPAAALARPSGPAEPPATPTPAVASTRAGTSSPPKDAAPAPAVSKEELDRNAIFQILCGGAMLQDVTVQNHLWRVAGSLAERSWTPPRVTVRVVVDSSGR